MGTFADIVIATVAVAALVLSLKNYQAQKAAPLKEHQRQLRDELHKQINDLFSTLKDAALVLNQGGQAGPPPPAINTYVHHSSDISRRLTDRRIAGGRLALSAALAQAVGTTWLIAHGAEEHVKQNQSRAASEHPPIASRDQDVQRRSDTRAQLRENIKESIQDLENLRSQVIELDKQS